MLEFQFHVPTQFIFGKDVHKQLGSWVVDHGYRRAMIICGKSFAEKSGLMQGIVKDLEAHGIEHVMLKGVRPNPEVTMVRQGIELMRQEGCDIILAIGGGSVIDSAKAIALGTHYEGDVWELYETKKPVAWEVVPIATILTIPAAGSEASTSSVLNNDEQGRKTSYYSELIKSRVAFMNPELTYSLPPYQTAAGVVDMYSHILERYFSAGPATLVSDSIALGLLRTLRTEGPRAVDDPQNYEVRANVMWISTLAHNDICGLGRPGDWASHALEHELSAFNPNITHGAGLAVIFPAWMRYVYRSAPERFATYGREVFGLATTGDPLDDARAAIDATQQFFLSLGMPARLSAFNITENDIESFIPTLRANKGETFGTLMPLSLDDARLIYRLAL